MYACLLVWPMQFKEYCISSFKYHGIYLILGLLGVAFKEGNVYVKFQNTEENKIMCQFKPCSVKL